MILFFRKTMHIDINRGTVKADTLLYPIESDTIASLLMYIEEDGMTVEEFLDTFLVEVRADMYKETCQWSVFAVDSKENWIQYHREQLATKADEHRRLEDALKRSTCGA